MARYVVAEGWTHIFTEEDDAGRPIERERPTDWVLDTEQNKLVHLEIHRALGNERGSDDQIADVEESVLQNLDMASIEDLDLTETDELPDWAAPTPAPGV